jgi:hypothetical protein
MKNYVVLDVSKLEIIILEEYVFVEFLEKIKNHIKKFNAKNVDVEDVQVEIE